ncbi:MAG TPA: lipid-A-disaccharide synthase [Thermohalobaculum sp.]|nr:lipid-A-disaccharide synthase [Thermohalobaculum sp.]
MSRVARLWSTERAGGTKEPGSRLAPLIYLVAGEPSGDRLGAALMHALRAELPELRFAGLGGREMAAAGLEPLFDIRALSVMGLTEVVPRLPRILGLMKRVVRDALAAEPDVLVTIDSPSFTLRVARRVRRRRPSLPVVHYVAPSVWAWRPGRAARMAAHVDHVLALLPFEPPYMEEAGMGCDFVGHPVAERPAPAPEAGARYRAELGLRPGQPLVLMAPGSRPGEVRRLLPLFRRTVEALAAERPGLAVVVPLAETVADLVERRLRRMTPRPHFVRPEAGEHQKWLAMAAADVALVASGTVVLELAAVGTPMVACYRASPVTAAMVRRMLRVKSANLVNLVSDSRVVPEFYQERARQHLVEPALAELLDDETARERQRAAMRSVMATLGGGSVPPSARAARAVLRVLAAARAADEDG